MVIRDRGPRIAVNPGIPPAFIAASVGLLLRAYEECPRVLAGTARIEGAVEATRGRTPGQGASQRERARIREPQNIIRPADRVPQPKPLGAREEGRLWLEIRRVRRAEMQIVEVPAAPRRQTPTWKSRRERPVLAGRAPRP